MSIIGSERRCCCAFCKLLKYEIVTNNHLYNIVKGNSFLILPSVKLAVIFLALLLEFSLNALFYDLSSEEEKPLLWEGISENFWVAVYSVLIAIAPLLLIGLMFTPSSKAI